MQDEKAKDTKFPEANLTTFITGMMMEGLVALGEVENPIDKKKEFRQEHAKYIIDTLSMLKEKMSGGATTEELSMVDGILYELRMKYVTHKDGE